MVTAAPRIERVPALYVSQLLAAGKLPSAPAEVVAAARVPEHRSMTLAEAASLTWLLAGPIDAPRGVAAFRDVYDFQASSDLREVTHVAGSARGVVELVRFLIADAAPFRCIGCVDRSNLTMIRLLERLGILSKRVLWESR